MDNLYIEERRDIEHPITGNFVQIASRMVYTREQAHHLKEMGIDVEEHMRERVVRELNMKYHQTMLEYYMEDYNTRTDLKISPREKKAHLEIALDKDQYMNWTISAAIYDIIKQQFDFRPVKCYMSDMLFYYMEKVKVFGFKEYKDQSYTKETSGDFTIRYKDYGMNLERELKIEVLRPEYIRSLSERTGELFCLFYDEEYTSKYFILKFV